jgi:hypothetical protein
VALIKVKMPTPTRNPKNFAYLFSLNSNSSTIMLEAAMKTNVPALTLNAIPTKASALN